MLHLQAPDRWKNIVRLAFSPNGSALLGGCHDYGIVNWDINSGAVTARHRLRLGSVLGLLLSPNGDFVVVPSEWEGLVHLSYPSLAVLSSVQALTPLSEDKYIRFAAVSPDGSRVLRSRFASSGQPIPYGIAVATRPPFWDSVLWEQFDPRWVSHTAAFLDSGLLATADEPRHQRIKSRVAVRDANSGSVIREVPCPTKELRELVVSPEGRWLALVAGRSIWVWSVEDWSAPPKKLLNPTRPHFTGVAFHPSGRFLAATSNDTTVKLYDTATWQLDRTFTWDVGRLRSVAFSPDGALAAVGSDTGRVVVWDVDL